MAREAALAVRRRFDLGVPVCDCCLDRALVQHGLTIGFFPFAGRVTEMLVGDNLLLNPNLAPEDRRWLKAHALAHRLLHRGNQMELDLIAPEIKAKQETQATVFSGYLFMGTLDWAWPGMTVWEAAREARVPAERLRKWTDLVADELKTLAVASGE